MLYSNKNGIEYIRLGNYIKRSTRNNSQLEYGTELIAGVSNEGVFTTPKGDVTGVNLKPYKIVNNGAFVYNPSRLDLGSISVCSILSRNEHLWPVAPSVFCSNSSISCIYPCCVPWLCFHTGSCRSRGTSAIRTVYVHVQCHTPSRA